MSKFLIHYSEIGLKGRNRNFFERKLIDNIKAISKHNNLNLKSIEDIHNALICDFDSETEKINHCLSGIFGIKYFASIHETEKDINKIILECESIIKNISKEGIKEISFKTKRSDKNFLINSIEINKILGEIANKNSLKVNYKDAEKKIYLEIGMKKCYIYEKKLFGLGGLPVGVSGKVLCLLSGGIDSPVAAWQMMKRGCKVDFLHVHNFKNNEEAEKEKIIEIVKILNKYQFNANIYFVPYNIYQFHMIDKIIGDDLVLFRHYLFRLAEKISIEKKYKGIVTGDNLGQVASQTLENIMASEHSINFPIFRPLLTFDKEEIIDISRKINLYEISIKEYKDCCSILARKPKTKTNLEKFEKIIEKADIKGLIDKSIKETKILSVNFEDTKEFK